MADRSAATPPRLGHAGQAARVTGSADGAARRQVSRMLPGREGDCAPRGACPSRSNPVSSQSAASPGSLRSRPQRTRAMPRARRRAAHGDLRCLASVPLGDHEPRRSSCAANGLQPNRTRRHPYTQTANERRDDRAPAAPAAPAARAASCEPRRVRSGFVGVMGDSLRQGREPSQSPCGVRTDAQHGQHETRSTR